MTPVTPTHAGWHLFLDASPVDAGFEKALRGVLGEPSLASVAWGCGTENPSQGLVRTTLVYVQVDPLRPLDAARTFHVFTGRAHLLLEAGGRYRLEAA